MASQCAPADPRLARELGANEFGMRNYVVALLKVGPNRNQDAATAASLQRAHLDNIRRLLETGQLLMAGPFTDDGDLRGLYVFNVETIDDARRLTETDPAIAAGRLVMDLRPWYGSAALMQVPAVHSRIAAKHH